MALTFQETNGIGFVTFDQDDSKVNLLSTDMLKRLDTVLDEVKKKTNLKAVIFRSAKKDVFIAGADIKEIEKIVEPTDGRKKAQAGQNIMNKIEDLPFPTIAVIDGVALGGGCELALSCLYRIATFNPKVQIGLPEVNLGFIPGFGGTYRLPRIVGLSEGIKMILSGKGIDGSKALKCGLVDTLVPSAGLDTHVMKLVEDIVSGKIKKKRYYRKNKKGMPQFLDENRLGNMLVFKESKKSVLKMTKGFYPAPLRAIEVIKANFYCDRTKGLEIESRAFGELAITEVSKNCVHVFYLSEKYRKLSLDDANIKPVDVTRSAVLGAGVMGGGVAQLMAARDIFCRLKDITHEANIKGLQAAAKIFKGEVTKRKYTPAVARAKMDQITTTLDYSGFKSVDVVIEAVVENLDIKKKVFEELSRAVNSNAILATNTSALSVTEMAKVCQDPSKVIGIHFFNPVHRMPLIEVITTPMTSKETIATTLNLVRKLGKTPILVKDSCGFIVNRILLAYINEAGRMLDETGQMERIDKVATDFGMPMGPFVLSDEVGLDVGVKVLHILEKAFGGHFKAADIFEKVAAKKLLGKKSGKGYYIHGKERTPNPEVLAMFSSSKPLNETEALERMIYMMVNEAAKCLEENVVSDPGAIDVGMIFGTGFPPFRGGLLRYADNVGIKKVVAKLEDLNKRYPGNFKPSAYLSNMARDNKRFYE